MKVEQGFEITSEPKNDAVAPHFSAIGYFIRISVVFWAVSNG